MPSTAPAPASLCTCPCASRVTSRFYEDRSGVFRILYASGNSLAILDRDASGAHLTVQVVLHAIQDFR